MHIQHHISLKEYNTMQVDCTAQHFVIIESLDEFIALTQDELWQATSKKLIIGGGSNILLTQDSYDGIVVVNQIQGKELIRDEGDTVLIKVGGGENWDSFVDRSIQQGYTGIENLVSIPGTVGAAPMQNIGAYGCEVATQIDRVTGYDWLVHRVKHFPQSECCFGYRDSIFKSTLNQRFFIADVTFRLHKYTPETYQPNISYGAVAKQLEGVPQPTPQHIADTIKAIRASKLPDRHQIGTAGSFFQNPIVPKDKADELLQEYPELTVYDVHEKYRKLSAGQLIELAGLKGYSAGDAGTYQNHALVIVNHGHATGSELLHVASHIQSTVKKQFGVNLRPEVGIVQ